LSEAKRIRSPAKSAGGGPVLPPPVPMEARDDDVVAAPSGGGARTEADEPMGRGAAGLPPASRSNGHSAAEFSPGSPFDSALAAYRAHRFAESGRAFDALSSGDVNADLWAARSLRDGSGCRAAVARFNEVADRAPSSPPGWDAALEGARCYRLLGDAAGARTRLTPLLKVPTFADRARAELSSLSRGYASPLPATPAGSP
jgi:hypothetical protein